MRGGRILSVFYVNIKELFRDKGGIFFTFLFPILLMVLFGFIFSDVEETIYDIHIQDLDGSEVSENFTSALKGMNTFKVHEIDPERDVNDLIEDNDLDFVVVIPPGYGDSIHAAAMGDMNSSVNITVKYDPSIQSTQVKMSILNSVLQEMNEKVSGGRKILGMDPESVFTESFEYIDFFIPGLIGMTVMTGAVFGTIFGDTELRKKGIFRKLSTTPITRGEWILSNMLFQLFLAALATAEILFIGWLIFGSTLHLNPVFFAILIFEAFAFTGLSMLVVRFVKEAQAASALGNAITFPMMFLSGTFFSVEGFPTFLKVVAKLLPLYYVNEGLREAMIFNDTMEALENMLPIALFAVVVFILGVSLTTWKQD
ncbi:MAG: ABC transporter permease [Candidatus Thermoplasmatota archaeon]|nr:ABC transporter permease [Candidatus Thermoplasmatota archaeon]